MHGKVMTIPVEGGPPCSPREIAAPQHFLPSEVCAEGNISICHTCLNSAKSYRWS